MTWQGGCGMPQKPLECGQLENNHLRHDWLRLVMALMPSGRRHSQLTHPGCNLVDLSAGSVMLLLITWPAWGDHWVLERDLVI